MKNRNLQHSDNWETPIDLYEQLDRIYDFDFDPCPIHLKEITPDQDGLLIPWGKSNFVNPPYSRRLKEAFVKKAIEVAQEDGVQCVMLLPVSTSTKLFHDHILPNAKDIIFLKGRVKFKGYNTKGEYVTNQSGMHDSMVVVFEGKKR